MASMVIFSSDGVVAEWNKQVAYTVRYGDGAARSYSTSEKAIAAAKRKVANLRAAKKARGA